MNPLPTSGLLTDNKVSGNNSLGGIFQGDTLLQGEADFHSEFALLWQQLAATSGKELPQATVAQQYFRPELVQQLREQLELAPQQLPALPAPAIETIARVMQATTALNHGANIVPGLNTASIYQPAMLKPEQTRAQSGEALEQPVSKLLNAREQLTRLLPQEALEELSHYRETPNKDKFDLDLMRQTSGIRLFTSESEQKPSPDTLLREVQQGKVMEHLVGIDKVNSTATGAFSAGVLQTALQSQPISQLPRVEVPVSQAQWGQAVGERLMFMVNNKVQAASIILNPPELGPIEVKVNLNHDQASVHFVSNHAAVRDAIEEALPRLREMFAQNGLQLTDANVSQQSAQQQQHDQGFKQGHVANAIAVDDNTDGQQELSSGEMTDYLVNDGLVDHYV